MFLDSRAYFLIIPCSVLGILVEFDLSFSSIIVNVRSNGLPENQHRYGLLSRCQTASKVGHSSMAGQIRILWALVAQSRPNEAPWRFVLLSPNRYLVRSEPSLLSFLLSQFKK